MRKEKTLCGTKETTLPNYWHYEVKTLDLKKKMKRDREINGNRNFGIAFITFYKIDYAKDIRKNWRQYKKEMKQKYPEKAELLEVSNWTLEKAPCPSDIIWENIN